MKTCNTFNIKNVNIAITTNTSSSKKKIPIRFRIIVIWFETSMQIGWARTQEQGLPLKTEYLINKTQSCCKQLLGLDSDFKNNKTLTVMFHNETWPRCRGGIFHSKGEILLSSERATLLYKWKTLDPLFEGLAPFTWYQMNVLVFWNKFNLTSV